MENTVVHAFGILGFIALIIFVIYKIFPTLCRWERMLALLLFDDWGNPDFLPPPKNKDKQGK